MRNTLRLGAGCKAANASLLPCCAGLPLPMRRYHAVCARRRYEKGKILIFVSSQDRCDNLFRDLLKVGSSETEMKKRDGWKKKQIRVAPPKLTG
jgi:hypothetical protein